MPRDLIVTTPKSEMANAAAEAEWAQHQGGGPGVHYFRRIHSIPKEDGVGPGSRVFYVEDGYVRGFCTLLGIDDGSGTCEVTSRDWGEGAQLIMRADSWKWIRPIPMKGFQGWRYWPPWGLDDCFPNEVPVNVIGNWRDPRPVQCTACQGEGICGNCGDDGGDCMYCHGSGDCPDCAGNGWVIP